MSAFARYRSLPKWCAFWITTCCCIVACDTRRETSPYVNRPTVPRPPADQKTSDDSTATVSEPLVRIRIERAIGRLTVDGPASVLIKSEPSSTLVAKTPLDLTRINGRWHNHGQTLANQTATAEKLLIEPLGISNLKSNGHPYPGGMQLVSVTPDTFDVVNQVGIETYLPGVLEHELYDRWHMSTYQALAIAARSYALACMFDTRYRHYDVENTQASQAYAGAIANDKARQAVRDTRAVVLTHDNKIIKTFYSSTCGGAGLSPTEAFGGKGPPPLTPRHLCKTCTDSKFYQWDPITRNRTILSRRLVAFGKHHELPMGQFSRIADIQIVERNKLNRPCYFVVIDSSGKRQPLRPESLRNACNFYSDQMKIAPPPAAMRLPSSFFDVKVSGEMVNFYNGRGNGHGVGLCQFGANGLAKQGMDPLDILQFYYPDAKTERAY